MPILTRAPDDGDSHPLKMQLPGTAPPSSAPIAGAPPSADSLDFIWSEYEQYLAGVAAARENSVDVTPQPQFVAKAAVMPASGSTVGAGTDIAGGMKLFINITSDELIDIPTVMTDDDIAELKSANAAIVPPVGALRFAMSVGPVSECKDRHGNVAAVVDVIVHPKALDSDDISAEHEAFSTALMVRMGQQPVSPSITAQARREACRRAVAAFALNKIAEKYSFSVDEAHDIKLPNIKYKGNLPPTAQRIRKKPFTASQPVEPAKKLVEELPTQNPPKKTQETLPQREQYKSDDGRIISPHAETTTTHKQTPEHTLTAVTQSGLHTQLEPHGERPFGLSLQIKLPSVSSVSELDVSISSTDIRIESIGTAAHRYLLSVKLPHSIDEDSANAKFNKKKHILTVTMQTLTASALPANLTTSPATTERAPINWLNHIQLTNSLVRMSFFE